MVVLSVFDQCRTLAIDAATGRRLWDFRGRLQVRAFARDQDPTRDGAEPAVQLGELDARQHVLGIRSTQ
jgi:hypothetical protein